MYGLDLFSGIGGITKALEGYVNPVAYCENNQFAQNVLLSRQATKDLPRAPIWEDVRTLRGYMLPHIDIIYGGFPCQDISVAWHGKGLDGERSGLFSEIVRLAGEIRPRFIFLENVRNIVNKGLKEVASEMVGLGYDCRWEILSAAEVGAKHRRERWFMLAHSNVPGWRNGLPKENKYFTKDIKYSWKDETFNLSACRNESEYEGDPESIRMADGIPFWVDRIRALGNAVVPAQAREAFERLMGLK